MSAPPSIDVDVVHDRRDGTTIKRKAIVRVLPRIDLPREVVDLFACIHVGNGLLDLHLFLTRNQAGELIDMLQEALVLVGGRDQ